MSHLATHLAMVAACRLRTINSSRLRTSRLIATNPRHRRHHLLVRETSTARLAAHSRTRSEMRKMSASRHAQKARLVWAW